MARRMALACTSKLTHMMADGQVGGPFHHYCKGISNEIIQCLLFPSTDSKAPLIGVEYFVAKDLARKEVPLITWNRNFHDHEVEIATGRVLILDIEDKNKVAEIAAAAAQTRAKHTQHCLLYTSPSPRDRTRSRMPSSA